MSRVNLCGIGDVTVRSGEGCQCLVRLRILVVGVRVCDVHVMRPVDTGVVIWG